MQISALFPLAALGLFLTTEPEPPKPELTHQHVTIEGFAPREVSAYLVGTPPEISHGESLWQGSGWWIADRDNHFARNSYSNVAAASLYIEITPEAGNAYMASYAVALTESNETPFAVGFLSAGLGAIPVSNSLGQVNWALNDQAPWLSLLPVSSGGVMVEAYAEGTLVGSRTFSNVSGLNSYAITLDTTGGDWTVLFEFNDQPVASRYTYKAEPGVVAVGFGNSGVEGHNTRAEVDLFELREQFEIRHPNEPRPNVVLIMTDDQGYANLGCHGHPFLLTPHMDTLASQSLRFDDFHASPYCIPARASLMTGRDADRTGIHTDLTGSSFLRENEVVVAQMFKHAGYATGLFGKWHLGDNYPQNPESRGFDEVVRHLGGGIGVVNDYWDNCYGDDSYYHNGTPSNYVGYCTDIFFNEAMDFIDASVQQNKPFFLYLATNVPHAPFICPTAYSAPYSHLPGGAPQFFGMLANLDENIGTMRAFLAARGLDENTIFIFTSDNGCTPISGYDDNYNAGLRGIKLSQYDGGHRVPLFIHWPQVGYDKERFIDKLTAHVDLVPTLLDLCEIPAPRGVEFDGISLRPLMEKGDDAKWPDRIVMTSAQNAKAPAKWRTTTVMSERWRLVNGTELYDIDADRGQTNDVYTAYPEVVQRLTGWYDAWWDSLDPETFETVELHLVDPDSETVMLGYYDAVDTHAFASQGGIRLAKEIEPPGSTHSAFWPVRIPSDGVYNFELRRWPVEANAAIDAALPAGDMIYGLRTSRIIPGVSFPAVEAQLRIGAHSLTQPVTAGSLGSTFSVSLQEGSAQLSAKFLDAAGNALDAYFVYVTKDD